MPALFVFLLKVNIALIVFCLGYYLVLRKLTFYTLNRAYLVLGIICSSVYPLIDVDAFLQRHQQLAPVQRVAINWQAQAIQFAAQPAYWTLLTYLFWTGVLVFAARLLMQFISLYKLYQKSSPDVIHDHNVRVTDADISPFSFWQNIYINPENIDHIDLANVLQHEQVHVSEWHTLDILLTELSVVAYWFNPGVWLMKKAVRENIEFITDRKILQQGANSKAYQYSLLHVSMAANPSADITNHFNFSTLKKRITMMNAKRSSNLNLTRYAFLAPCVIVCLFVAGISRAEIIKTGKVAYKKVTASVQTLVHAKDKSLLTAADLHFNQTDTPKKTKSKSITFTTVPDTAKIKSLVFKYSKHGDSASYVVNGKKLTEAEFKKLESTYQNVNSNQSADVRIDDGYAIKSDNVNKVVVISDGKKDTTKKQFTVAYSYLLDSDNDKDSPKVVDIRLSAPPSQSDFNNKLIIINGKEANNKDLKKLSAADIDTVTSFGANDQNSGDGQPFIKKYGDKAKNGVIIITTKKKN